MNIILDVIKWTIILGIGLFFIRSLLMRIEEKMNRIKLDDIELGYFYIKKFNELSDKIDKLSKVKIDDYEIEIEFNEERCIGDASGDIDIKNNNLNKIIRFYFDKDKVVYMTNDLILLKNLSGIGFDLRLKEMRELMKERNAIFGF